MKNILTYILIGISSLFGGLFVQDQYGAFGDPFVSLQLASNPQADYILSTDGTNNSWIVNSGGGSTLHVDGGGFVYPQTGDYHAAPYYNATSSTASTFVGGFVSQASSTVDGALTVTGTLTGSLTGNADTATALAANGGNCSAGNAPLGVDASGASESCFDVWTEAENTSAAYLSNITSESLEDLSDVASFVQSTNDVLYWTGSTWNVTATSSWDTNTQLTQEQVEDYAGGMVTGNTETGITVTYQDGDGTIDFDVALGTAIDSSEITDDTIAFNDVAHTLTLAGNPALAASQCYWASTGIICEGSTDNTAETLLTFTNPSSDVTLTFGNTTGTIAITTSAMTGTFDGNNFAGGAIGQNQILYGSAAGSIAELTVASSSVITSNGTDIIALAGIFPAMLGSVDSAGDEECLTYESTGATFQWQTCGSGSGLFTQFDGTAIRTTTANDHLVLGNTATSTTDLVLEVTGDVGISEKLEHLGDTDTYVQFTDDQIQWVTGASTAFTANASSITFNPVNDNNLSWQVDTAGGDYALYAWNSTSFTAQRGNIGVGTSTPYSLLTVDGTFAVGTNGTEFTIDASGNIVVSGALDAGGATSLEIPNGSNPTIDSVGEIGFDTTDQQLLIADSNNTARVFASAERLLFAFTLASTSADFLSGGIIDIPSQTKDGRDITQFRCHVDGGTSIVVNVSDGTNDTETITCGTTQTSDTDVATNSTFTADELWEVQIGTITGTPDYLIFEAYGYITRE